MPSSAFASSPSMDIRRAVSRALRPASTSTRVPFATSNTELPVEPLPSTESFMFVFVRQTFGLSCQVEQTNLSDSLQASTNCSFSLSLWERVGERAYERQASHPPLTPPKGRGRNRMFQAT